MKIWFHSKFNVNDKKRLITVFFNQFFSPKYSTCPRAVSPASWQDGWCPLTFLQTINCGNCCGATITSAFDGGDKSNRQPWFIPLFTTVRWVFDFTQLNLTLMMMMMHHKHWMRTSVLWAAHNQSNTTTGRHTGAETRNTQHEFFLIESPEKTLGEGEDLDSTFFLFLFLLFDYFRFFIPLCWVLFYFIFFKWWWHVFLGVPWVPKFGGPDSEHRKFWWNWKTDWRTGPKNFYGCAEQEALEDSPVIAESRSQKDGRGPLFHLTHGRWMVNPFADAADKWVNIAQFCRDHNQLEKEK